MPTLKELAALADKDKLSHAAERDKKKAEYAKFVEEERVKETLRSIQPYSNPSDNMPDTISGAAPIAKSTFSPQNQGQPIDLSGMFNNTNGAAIGFNNPNTVVPLQQTYANSIAKQEQAKKDQEILRQLQSQGQGLDVQLAGLSGINKGLTWGIKNPATTPEQKEAQRIAQEAHPYVSGIGEMAGFIGSPLTKASGAIGGALGKLFGKGVQAVAPKIAPIVEKTIVKTAARTGFEMGGFGATSKAAEIKQSGGNISDNLGTIAKAGAVNAVVGAGLGAGFSGATNLVKNAYTNSAGVVTRKALEDINKSMAKFTNEGVTAKTSTPYQGNSPSAQKVINRFDLGNKVRATTKTSDQLLIPEKTARRPAEEVITGYPTNFPLKSKPIQDVLPAGKKVLSLPPATPELPPAKPVKLSEAPQGKFSVKSNETISNLTPQNKTAKPIQQYSKTIKEYNKNQIEPPNYKRETPFKATPGELASVSRPPKVQSEFIKETFQTPKEPLKTMPKAKPQPKPITQQNIQATESSVSPLKPQSNVNSPSIENKPFKTQPTAIKTQSPMQPSKTPQKTFIPNPNKKISQFGTNTYKRTTEIPKDIKDATPMKTFGFKSNSDAQIKIKAQSNILKDYEGTKQKLINKDVFTDIEQHESAMIAKQLAKEAKKSPNKMVEYLDFLERGTKKGASEAGKSLRAIDIAWEKSPTPEKAIMAAQKEIKLAEESASKKVIMHIDGETLKYTKVVKDVVKQVSKDITDSLFRSKDGLILFKNLDLQKFASKKGRLEQLIAKHYSSDPLSRGSMVNKIIKEYGFTGDDASKLADMINRQFDMKFSKDADRYLKTLLNSKEGVKNPTLDKVLKLIKAGAYDDASIRNVIKEKYGLPVLSQEEAKFIMNEMDRISKMKEGSRDYAIALAKVRQLIEEKKPSSWYDKQKAVKDVALLGNPTTFAINIGGNTGVAVADVTSQHVFGIALDKLVSLRTGQRTIGKSSTKLFTGAKEGAIDAVIDSTGGLRLKDLKGLPVKEQVKKIIEGIQNPISRPIFEQTENKFELTSKGLAFKGKNRLQQSPNKAVRGVGEFLAKTGKTGRVIMNMLYTSLGGPDRVFKQSHYDDTLNMLIKTNKVKEPTQEMKKLAETIAMERTFTDVNFLSNLGKIILHSPDRLANHPQVANIIRFTINSVFPYLTTPMNIAKRTIEYGPLGLIEGIIRYGKIIAKPEGVTLAQQRYAIDRVSRGLAGTALLYTGIEAYKKGMATGKEDLTNTDKRTFLNEFQIGANSLKMGDTTIDLTRLQPVTSSFIAGVNLSENLSKSESEQSKKGMAIDTVDNMTSAIGGAIEFYTDNPFLQQAREILGSKTGSKSISENVSNFALGVPNQYFPNVLKKSAYVSDEFQRETYDESSVQQRLINTFKKQTPGAREELPQKYGTLGQPLKEYNGNNSFWNVFFNPIKVGKAEPSPVQSELLRLYEGTKSNSVFPNVADKYIEWNGKKKMFTGAEKQQFQKIMGEKTNEALSKLVKQGDYYRAKDDGKVKAVQQTIENAKAQATEEMAKELGLESKIKKKPQKSTVKIPNKGKN